jgi:hypothetical protein
MNVLEIGSRKGRFVRGKCSRGSARFAGGEDKDASGRECGVRKMLNFKAAQFRSPELLTVIHNPMQGDSLRNFTTDLHE